MKLLQILSFTYYGYFMKSQCCRDYNASYAKAVFLREINSFRYDKRLRREIFYDYLFFYRLQEVKI